MFTSNKFSFADIGAEWLQSILCSIGEGLFATNTEGEILFVNTCAEKITQIFLTANENVNIVNVCQMVNTTSEHENICFAEWIQDFIEYHGGKRSYRFINNGVFIEIECKVYKINNIQTHLGYLFVFHDISEKCKIEMQMTEQQKNHQNELLQTVVNTLEKERQRIAEELHDGIGVSLSSVSYQLSNLEKKIVETNMSEISTILKNAQIQLKETIQEIRNISTNLSPSALNDFGLIHLINKLVQDVSHSTAIQMYFNHEGFGTRLPQSHEIFFYRIVQELLNNAIKYSQADTINIDIIWNKKVISLIIEDNGIGFDANNIIPQGSGTGLKNIKTRVEILNGNLHIDSEPNKGTCIMIDIPFSN